LRLGTLKVSATSQKMARISASAQSI
jgi:hypothetical protein